MTFLYKIFIVKEKFCSTSTYRPCARNNLSKISNPHSSSFCLYFLEYMSVKFDMKESKLYSY